GDGAASDGPAGDGAPGDGPWEIVIDGTTPADDPAAAAAVVGPFAAAGATWWIEADWEHSSVAGLRRRIAAGPPDLSRR
ncbi:MAG: LLM class flavin-dependent oxidoreductase, partial [Candidatus Limnocylindrales bacterium]